MGKRGYIVAGKNEGEKEKEEGYVKRHNSKHVNYHHNTNLEAVPEWRDSACNPERRIPSYTPPFPSVPKAGHNDRCNSISNHNDNLIHPEAALATTPARWEPHKSFPAHQIHIVTPPEAEVEAE